LIVAEARVQVGTVRRPPIPICGTVKIHRRGKRRARAERADSIDDPAAENPRDGFPLEVKGNGIGGSQDKILLRIEGGTRIVAAQVLEIEHRDRFLV
jgi:hypothetical protein